ncbi:unknown protein [Microcystis aeruginosa NIES-843]|uniref:Uncharacterized protein n=1 Tax=Microcystis aeruginosa (strain NIES-843 / IAM M-2473) TaxID=449447 RepID=B0JLQ1_MICAN|nr:unknown protein [Microcystis aeruginosa NIES-843]
MRNRSEGLKTPALSLFDLEGVCFQTCEVILLFLNFPRINILAMAQSLTEPELKQCNTNKLLGTNS